MTPVMKKKKPSNETNDPVDAETFVRAWQESFSIDDFLERTGMNHGSASVRASRYRSLGIPLKNMFKGGKAKLDIDGLRSLAQKSFKEELQIQTDRELRMQEEEQELSDET